MKKKIKITFNSPVILVFVMLCFIATLLGVISNGKITQEIFMTYHSKLTNPLTYLRFIYLTILIHTFSVSAFSSLSKTIFY